MSYQGKNSWAPVRPYTLAEESLGVQFSSVRRVLYLFNSPLTLSQPGFFRVPKTKGGANVPPPPLAEKTRLSFSESIQVKFSISLLRAKSLRVLFLFNSILATLWKGFSKSSLWKETVKTTTFVTEQAGWETPHSDILSLCTWAMCDTT